MLAELDPVWTWLIEMTLWSGALFGALLIVDRLSRRQVSPAWRAALYLAVFVRVGLPTDWSSPIGIVGAGGPSPFASREEAR